MSTTYVYKRSLVPLLVAGGGVGLLVGSAVVGLYARSRYLDAVDARDSDGVHSAARTADVGTAIGIVGGDRCRSRLVLRV